MARILCAWSPLWAISNWRRRNPSAAQASPFALIESAKGTRRLSAVDRAGRRLGLYVGQKATDAAAIAPDLITAEAEPEADALALSALVDWCVRFSPAVAADEPDGLFLDISGVAHLWGGEEALLADFRARLMANGLAFRVAIADTPGAAWALAHYGEDGAIARPGQQIGLLAPLPPAALRLAPETAAQIDRLGLKALAQLFDIPRAPLARRFGIETLTRIDQALGRSKEALTYRRPPNPWFARLAFAEPISAPDDMARVTIDVAAKLCARLEKEGQGARRFELCFHRLDGHVAPLTIGLSLAGRDAARIAKLFAPKLETVDPGFGIEVVTLEAAEVEPVSGRQARLDSLIEAGGAEGLAPLIDRLTNRLGEDRVWRSRPVESHVPEQSAAPGAPMAPPLAGWDPERPRPLRLFSRPEPLELVMAPIPDDPPVQFRWRGQMHRVRRAEGPERIGEEWWRGAIEDARTTHIRDYYRVEDEAGARFWLFRAGIYAPGVEAKWWLHGLFA
ncbi:MAG: DNA polymerase Y family protein [Phenylobacterium sp.]|nr:DNA polymerase Y family protein [Phenylobacterium sp.]